MICTKERGDVQLDESSSEQPGPNPADLSRLVGEARAVEGLDRLAIAKKINDLLIALRAPGNEAAEAQAVLGELDVSALDGLIDGHGRDCRKEAVETLLACGFPHALKVAPDDLVHARQTARRQRPLLNDAGEPTENFTPYHLKLTAWLAYSGAALQLAGSLYSLPTSPFFGALGALGAVLVGVGGWRAARLFKSDAATAPLMFLLSGGGAGLIGAAFTANPMAGASIATSVVTGLFLSKMQDDGKIP